MKFFEVFKAGTYPQGKFTKAQIEELAKNYDPQFCEAPITLDHEQKGPAYGWVSELKSENGKLRASFKDLSDDLKEFVQSGKYKKISVEIYRNLEGKQPYLKAVSFLGASIPQVKGMEAVEFKEGESDIYEFEAEINDDTAEIEQYKERIADLESDIAKFKEQANGRADLEKELDEIKTSIKKQEFDGFIDKQIDAGVLVPANKDVVFQVLSELDNLKKFGSEVNVIDDFKSFIESLPKQIEFQELANKEKNSKKKTEPEKFANADEESLEIFREATALAEKENITFKEALLKLNI